MARRRVLLAVERGVERAVGHQRQAVVGLAAAQPRLHRRSDVDQDELVLVRRGDIDIRSDGRAQRRRIAAVNRVLRPGAVDVVDVEAARRGDGIDVEFQGRLADAGRSRDRRQIELNVSDLRGAIDVEQELGAIVGGGRRRVGIAVGAGRDLRVGRTPQEHQQTQQ